MSDNLNFEQVFFFLEFKDHHHHQHLSFNHHHNHQGDTRYFIYKQCFFSAQAQMLLSEIQNSLKLALPYLTKRCLKC